MNAAESKIAEQIAEVAGRLQEQRTGHAPKAVTVVLSEDTLVINFHEALTPAERALARSPAGAAQVQEFHRQLFANATDELRQEIKRITGRDVREAAAEVETATGTVVHAFTTGAMVQVFLLSPNGKPKAGADGDGGPRQPRGGRRFSRRAGRQCFRMIQHSKLTRTVIDMAAFWMCELEPAKMAGSDAFNRQQISETTGNDSHRGSSGRVWRAGPRTLRVLVVDDEQDTADGLVKLVSRWGHAARWAYDGATGLKVAAAQHPDVVLLDLEMPFMDGCEVARQLRLDIPKYQCFIIGVTGWADEQCRRQCTEAGIDLVLLKPVEPSLMRNAVDAGIRTRESAADRQQSGEGRRPSRRRALVWP